jgi:hypothetical protein
MMDSTHEVLLERVKRLSSLPASRQVAFSAAAVESLARKTHERLEEENLDKAVDHTLALLWEVIDGTENSSSELAEMGEDLEDLKPPSDDDENVDIGYILSAVLYACDLALGKNSEESLYGLLYNVDCAKQFHTLHTLGGVDAGTVDGRVAEQVNEEIEFHLNLIEKLEQPDVALDRPHLLP